MKVNGKNKSLSDTKKLFDKKFKDYLNNESWNVVKTEIKTDSDSYSCVLTPASQMKFNDNKKDIFYNNDYQNKGICSKSSDEVNHSVNMWVSDIQDNGNKSLFKGIRHGILSPYSLK